MDTLKEAIAKYGGFSIRSLASNLGLGNREMIRLSGLLDGPENITFRPRELDAGDVSCTAELGILSTGFFSFKGQVHDSGMLRGDNYIVTIALKMNMDGAAPVWSHNGELGASLTGPDRDNSWQSDGWYAFLRDRWDEVQICSANCSLHQSTAWNQVAEEIRDILGIAAVATLAVMQSDPKARCEWQRDDNGGTIRRCSKFD